MTDSVALPSENSDKKSRRKRERHILSEQEKKWRNIAFIIFALFVILMILHYTFFVTFFNINDWASILVIALGIIMPGYWSNMGMVLWGGGRPIDGGRVCKDGKRLFGPGKTWRGFLLGPLLFGIPISLIIHGMVYYFWPNHLTPYLNYMYGRPDAYILFDIGTENVITVFQIYIAESFPKLLLRIIVISYGAAIGDLIGSWTKRRTKRTRGEPVWLVDQLDFVIICLLLAMPFVPLDIYFWNAVIFILILSPSLTIFSNMISYLLRFKSVPW